MKALSSCVVLASLGLFGCFVDPGEPNPPPRQQRPPSSSQTGVVRGSTSSAYDVRELSASMSAQCDGSALRVYAALLHDAGQFISLDGGDYFTARVGGGEEVRMQPEVDGVTVHYVASFPVNTSATDAVVALHRPSGKTAAPFSQVRVVGAFDVADADASFRAGNPLYFRLSPTPSSLADVKVELVGSCLNPNQKLPVRSAGDGRLFVDTATAAAPDMGSCDVTAHVRYETRGQVDSVYRRGPFGTIDAMEGLQVRSFTTRLMR